MATKLAVRASEAAELLSCDASTIRRYAQAGDLERIGSGRGTLYTMRSIESFLNGERGKWQKSAPQKQTTATAPSTKMLKMVRGGPRSVSEPVKSPFAAVLPRARKPS